MDSSSLGLLNLVFYALEVRLFVKGPLKSTLVLKTDIYVVELCLQSDALDTLPIVATLLFSLELLFATKQPWCSFKLFGEPDLSREQIEV